MNSQRLRVVIRTPLETIVDRQVIALRVPTETGQVGLRPRGEPSVLPIEPGLIVLRTRDGMGYVGTAGGLLHTNGQSANLLTPLAVVGDGINSVSQNLETALSAPSEEMEVRQTLERLETRILQELQHEDMTTEQAKGIA